MHLSKGKKMYFPVVDKTVSLWLNDSCTHIKDFDGKFAFAKKLQRAGGWCKPVRNA